VRQPTVTEFDRGKQVKRLYLTFAKSALLANVYPLPLSKYGISSMIYLCLLQQLLLQWCKKDKAWLSDLACSHGTNVTKQQNTKFLFPVVGII